MMKVSERKKNEYWNHFIARFYLEKEGGGYGITRAVLNKVKGKIWQDDVFWQDIIWRHGGDKVTPEQMREQDEESYLHCLGNFWGMIAALVGK